MQGPRIERVLERLGDLYTPANNVTKKDIRVWDGALAPGYGRIGQSSLEAIRLMASLEGLFLDPVYTAKSFSAIPSRVYTGDNTTGARVCFVHTGGLAALYAYEDQLGDLLGSRIDSQLRTQLHLNRKFLKWPENFASLNMGGDATSCRAPLGDHNNGGTLPNAVNLTDLPDF